MREKLGGLEFWGTRWDFAAILHTYLCALHALQDSLESLGALRIAGRKRRDRNIYRSPGIIGYILLENCALIKFFFVVNAMTRLL